MEARVSLARVVLLALPLMAASSTASAAGGPAAPTKNECIDANESAQRLVQTGKLVDARRDLLVCVSASCPGPIRDDCTQKLAEVQARTPTIVFEVIDDADHDMSAVRVTIDGHPLVDRLDGSAVAVDLGEHQFVFEAAGMAPEKRTLVLHEAEKDRRERVILVRAGAAAAATAPPADAAQPDNAAAPEAPAPASDGSTQRIVGLALGGVGAAGVIAGGVLGVLAKTTYDGALRSECSGKVSACNPQGISDGSTAHTEALVSTVGFIAGAALLAGGAYLYFTAPRDKGLAVGASTTPGVRPARGEVRVVSRSRLVRATGLAVVATACCASCSQLWGLEDLSGAAYDAGSAAESSSGGGGSDGPLAEGAPSTADAADDGGVESSVDEAAAEDVMHDGSPDDVLTTTDAEAGEAGPVESGLQDAADEDVAHVAEGGPETGGGDAAPDASCKNVEVPPSANVNATQWSYASSPSWSCTAAGTTTIDSTGTTGACPAVTGDTCGGTATLDCTNSVTQTTSGAQPVMVVRLSGLTVTGGHVLHLVGDKPIVLLVAGNVTVDSGGRIDASAAGVTPGPRRQQRDELRRIGRRRGHDGHPRERGRRRGRLRNQGRGRRRRRRRVRRACGRQRGQHGRRGHLAAAGRRLPGRRGRGPWRYRRRGRRRVRDQRVGHRDHRHRLERGDPQRSGRRIARSGAHRERAGRSATSTTPAAAAGAAGPSSSCLRRSPRSAAAASPGSTAAARRGRSRPTTAPAAPTAGEDGHTADDTAAAGGNGGGSATYDTSGATGGLYSATASAAVATAAGTAGSGTYSCSGGGGGGGHVEVTTGAATLLCQ